MLDRVASLIGGAADGMWLGTFHAIGVRVRDLPADIANRVPVEVAELDFVGAFCRATLKTRAAADVAVMADFSSNLIRDLGVDIGTKLDIALPPDRLRVFA